MHQLVNQRLVIMENEIKNRLLSILNREIENNFEADEMPESYAVAINPDFSDMVVCFNGRYPWHEDAMEWAVVTANSYDSIVREIKKYVHKNI